MTATAAALYERRRFNRLRQSPGGHRSCDKIGISRYSPPCTTARRGGCVINKISRSHRSRRSRGGFPSISIGKPPRPLLRLRAGALALRGDQRMLRDILLIARPPLLAVMQGGE